VLQAGRIWQMNRSMEFEARGSARLLLQDFRRIVWVRFALLLIAPALPLAAAVAAGLLSEIAGRYLFFVSVVPRNMAATFFGTAREAA